MIRNSFCENCNCYTKNEVIKFDDCYYCKECLDDITICCEACDTRVMIEDIVYGPSDECCCSTICVESCKGAEP